MNKMELEKFARVLLCVGVNLQKGESVLLQADTYSLPLAREMTRQAFDMGARDVQVSIDDPYVNQEITRGASLEVLRKAKEWELESIDSILRDGTGVQIGIRSTVPLDNSGIPNEKLLAFAAMKNDLRNVVRAYLNKGVLKWTGTAYPSREWAMKVYPELPEEEAYRKLELDILKMMRVDEESDPVDNWKKHCEELSERSAKLNGFDLKSLHITSELGTDITMNLVEGHIWTSAGEMGGQRVNAPYVANMPTEEVFTDPDFRSVNGIAYASFPLMMSGQLVEDFWIRFENGKAVDCGARKNVEFLRDALFRDETTRQLGEVALVSKRSPIRQTGRVFYNGLIDENAACHLAFGSSFPDCVKGGVDMSKEELMTLGVNFSVSHNDFMIGSDETKIVGIDHDGKEILIMEHGDFVI